MGAGQNASTYWRTGSDVGPGGLPDAWWEVRFPSALDVDRVEASFYMLPAASGNVTFELRDANGTPIVVRTPVNGTLLSNADSRAESFSPRVPGVRAVRIAFSNLQAQARVGLRTVYVFHTPSTSVLAALRVPWTGGRA